MNNIYYNNQIYRNNSIMSSVKSTTKNMRNNFTTSDMYSELKLHYPDLKINYAKIPSNFNENSMRSSGFGFGKEYGNLYNLTIDPKIEERMKYNPDYRKKILNQVNEQLSTPIPQIPGVKVASAGAIVSSDGTVTGYIIGEPDKESQEKERTWYIKRCKEKKDEQDKEKKEQAEIINNQYKNALIENANFQNNCNKININLYDHQYLINNYK